MGQAESRDISIPRDTLGIFKCLSEVGRVSTLEILFSQAEPLRLGTLRQALERRLQRSTTIATSTVINYLEDLTNEDLVERKGDGRYELTDLGASAVLGGVELGQSLRLLRENKQIPDLVDRFSKLSPETQQEILRRIEAASKQL